MRHVESHCDLPAAHRRRYRNRVVFCECGKGYVSRLSTRMPGDGLLAYTRAVWQWFPIDCRLGGDQ